MAYDSVDEAVEKYSYLAEHPVARRAIAAAGRARTLKGPHLRPARRGHARHLPGRNSAPVPEKPGRSALARLARALPWRRPAASYEEVERAEQTFYIRHLRPRNGGVRHRCQRGRAQPALLALRRRGGGRVPTPSKPAARCSLTSPRVLEATQRRNVVANRLAVCDRSGEVVLHCYDGPFSAFNSMAERPLAEYGLEVGRPALERVPATTLDRYCSDQGVSRIDLLKIDVEGAELQVLQGAARMLGERRIACLTFEFARPRSTWAIRRIRSLTCCAGPAIACRNIVGGDPLFPGGGNVRTAEIRYAGREAAMISLGPGLAVDELCPGCGGSLTVTDWLIPGMRPMARTLCASCDRSVLVDLPCGQALYSPMRLDPLTGDVFDRVGVPWYADWLREAYAERDAEPVEIEIRRRHLITRPVVLLDCIDVLYGHALLKLLNAQQYLQAGVRDVVVLIQPFLTELVPDGVAELWVVDLSLSRGAVWSDGLAKRIASEAARVGGLHLAPAHSQSAPVLVLHLRLLAGRSISAGSLARSPARCDLHMAARQAVGSAQAGPSGPGCPDRFGGGTPSRGRRDVSWL